MFGMKKSIKVMKQLEIVFPAPILTVRLSDGSTIGIHDLSADQISDFYAQMEQEALSYKASKATPEAKVTPEAKQTAKGK